MDKSLRLLEHHLYSGGNSTHTVVLRSEGDSAEKALLAQCLGRHSQAVERMRCKVRLPEFKVCPYCSLSAAPAEFLQLSLHFPNGKVQMTTVPTSRTAEKAQ